MEHVQDLGRFDEKMLVDFQRQAIILGDKKLWRKVAEELERRRRTKRAADEFCGVCQQIHPPNGKCHARNIFA